MFVDDSGRRRRAGRLVGTCLAALVLSYVAVVGLTFSGAPLVGRWAPPGIDRLSRPAGDDGLGVGPDAQVSPLPPAAAGSDALSEGRDVTAAANDTPQSIDTPAPAPVAETTTTTTTIAPGSSTNSTVPTPSSTVPENTHSTGGPPAEPPGKP